MYELWIKSSSGIWMLADLGADKPAMNYTSNNISELKHRNVDYSQRIFLPITPNNSKIFNYSDEFDAISDTPYRRHDCRLSSKSYTLAGKGSYITILRVKDNFECQIRSGTADLFQLLKDTDMSTLNLGYFTRSSSSAQSGEYHKFLAATFIQGGASNMGEMNSVKAFPFVPMGVVVKKILTDKGYSLVHNIGTAADDICTSLVNIKKTDGSQSSLIYEATNKGAIPVNQFMDLQVTNVATEGNLHIGSTDRFLRFTVPYTGRIRISFSVNKAYNAQFTRQIIGDISVGSENWFYAGSQGSASTSTTHDIIKGQSFSMQFKNNFVDANGDISNATGLVRISYIDLEEEQVPEGGRVYIAPNMGFKNQFDYFQTFLQLFGLTVAVDDINKIVYAYSMEKVYENKAKAIDWSKKLHHGENHSMAFSVLNYAQNNTIVFEENKEEFATNVGLFKIDNHTLDNSKELFKINIEAGKDNRVLGRFGEDEETYQNVANIPMFDDKGVFKGSKPHLVSIQDSHSFVSADQQRHKRALHQSMQSLINEHYKSLTSKMLVKARMIEDEFYLTDEDIETFDQFIPIYIDYYGAYFYVNKIKNYVSGQPTACELIKL